MTHMITKTSGESIMKLHKKDMTHVEPGEIRNNPLNPKEGMKLMTVDTRTMGNTLNVTHVKLDTIRIKAVKTEGVVQDDPLNLKRRVGIKTVAVKTETSGNTLNVTHSHLNRTQSGHKLDTIRLMAVKTFFPQRISRI